MDGCEIVVSPAPRRAQTWKILGSAIVVSGSAVKAAKSSIADATSPALASPAPTIEPAIASSVNSGITLASPAALIPCSRRTSGSQIPISRKYLASLRAQPGSPPLRATTPA